MGTNTYVINPAVSPGNQSVFYQMWKQVHGGHFVVWRWTYTPEEWADMMERLVAVPDADAQYGVEPNKSYENRYYWGNAQGYLVIMRSCWMIPVDPSKPTKRANIRANCLSNPSGLVLNLWWAEPPWPYAGHLSNTPWGTGKELAASIVLPATQTRQIVELSGAQTHLVPHNYGSDGLSPARFYTSNWACLLADLYGWQGWPMSYVGAEGGLISATIEVNPDLPGRTVTPLMPGPPQSRGGKPGAAHRTRL